jgi:hypothetical protein
VTVVIADPAAALCAYLASTVSTVLDTIPSAYGGGAAIFRPQLPEWVDSENPLGSITVRHAGGYTMFGSGLMQVADPRLDLTCYGSTAQQAAMIALTVAHALKQLTMSVWEGCTLYWAKIAGGPMPLPDQQTLWPAVWISAQVMHSEGAQA